MGSQGFPRVGGVRTTWSDTTGDRDGKDSFSQED